MCNINTSHFFLLQVTYAISVTLFMCIKQKCYFIYLQRTSGGVLVLYTTALCCSLNLFLAILLLLRYMLTLVAPTGAALHILLYANVMTTKAFLFYLYTQLVLLSNI